jgi:hypothetical protein
MLGLPFKAFWSCIKYSKDLMFFLDSFFLRFNKPRYSPLFRLNFDDKPKIDLDFYCEGANLVDTLTKLVFLLVKRIV